MNISKDTLERFYRVGWEKRWLLQLDNHFIPRNLGFRFRMRKTLKLIAKKRLSSFRVLDLGCGVGIYDVNLLRQFPNAAVYGIDLAESQVAGAKELAEEAGVTERAQFASGDVSGFSPQEQYDVIICSEVIAHLPDPSQCIGNIRKAAAQDTQIIISVPSRYSDQDGDIIHRQAAGDDFQAVESRDVDQLDSSKEVYSYYYHLYTLSEISDLLLSHGIRVRRARASHFLLREQPGFLKKLANSINVRVKTGWLDSLIISIYGSRHAEILILDCCLQDESSSGQKK